ncbi:Serine-threonine/tyrosine-protein kinase, catalytic domain [Sesbania bispinosa]|nr:Serine-threonine/tyrosine-protein kinase, catalytic domain [Sesbania bispinosa]
MAFDQNSSANDMRPPPTVVRTVPEEPLVLPASTTAVNGASGAMPLFYPASVSDAGMVGMGYGNVASGAAPTTWCVRPAVPIRHPTVNPAAAFSHAPSFPNRVVGGNAVDLSGSFVATAHGYPLNLGNWVTGNALDNGLQGNSRVVGNASDHAGGGALGGNGVNPPASQRGDQASEEGGGDDSVSGRKLKIMCSYGGKILPRPSDGMLRYVGGQTRIISVKRDVRFNDLVQKMVNIFGQPVVIKYQLPDEDLDALVSVSCPEDLENMMEEYERLIERSPDGSPKLRVFLFSASELDPSGVVQFVNLQDGGQRYVEAVNGITDGIGGKLTRKGSITSAASTQNSDLSGVEALDNSNAVQGDVSGAPVSSALSPEGNVAASHDATANFVVSEPVASIYSDASAVSLGIPVTNSGPTQAPPFQNEVELEKSVPITLSQQQFGLQQSGMEIPPPAPLQAFVDPRQEVMNHADYVQLPPHMGFPNPQLLGKPGSIYSQHQFHDNSPRLASHQVIPAVQMTMTQPSSHAGVRPSVIQPQTFMQLQQNHLNQYNDENTSGLRIHQLPPEQSYNAYPVQFPYGGNYGWVQVSPPEHVIFPDALLSQQPAMIPEKVQRVEDCYMCQKKLPHAHSDPVVQDQQNSCAGPIADSIPNYHSLPMEDNLRPQATNKVLVTAPMKEGNVEQAVGTRPRVISKLEPPGVVHCTDATGLPLEPEGERIFIVDRSDHPRNAAVIQETVGRTGEKQSPSDGLVGTAPLSFLDDIMRQQVAPVENRAKEDVVVNKPVNNDIPLVGGTSIATSECMVQESPTEYTNKLASTISKADAVENWIKQDLLKPIDGRMDTLKMGNPEFLPVEYNEVAQPPVWGIPGSNPQSKNGNHQKDDAVLSSISPSVRFGDVQDSSNSLFSNQDPWNVHATYFPPPRPNKIALKKEYSYKDQLCENLGNSGEQNLEPQLDDGLYQTFKQNLTLEEAQSAKEERQLQAVAEGLAASVLNSSTSSNPRDVSHCENIDNGDVQNNLIDIQCKDKTQVSSSVKIFPVQLSYNIAVGMWPVKLADLHHPNVVAFYGVVVDGPGGSVATVTEYMVNGSLRNSLQKNGRNLDKRKRLLIAMDVAFGMEYLHGKNIVHFDLKSDNLLVNLRDPHRPICKV